MSVVRLTLLGSVELRLDETTWSGTRNRAVAPPCSRGLCGDWADQTRTVLEQERIDAVVLWAAADLRRGRTGLVAGTLRAVVTQHPRTPARAAG